MLARLTRFDSSGTCDSAPLDGELHLVSNAWNVNPTVAEVDKHVLRAQQPNRLPASLSIAVRKAEALLRIVVLPQSFISFHFISIHFSSRSGLYHAILKQRRGLP